MITKVKTIKKNGEIVFFFILLVVFCILTAFCSHDINIKQKKNAQIKLGVLILL